MLEIVSFESVDDRTRAETLASGVKIDGIWGEIVEIVHRYIIAWVLVYVLCYMLVCLVIVKLTHSNKTSTISPIYLTRGGVVGKTSGSLRYVGIDGYFWTLSAYENSLFAFTIYFSNLAVNSSNNYNRWNGFTVQTSSQERRLMLSNQNLY